jgi:5S rRNA maturation endonuclease (ribonuclease M5)
VVYILADFDPGGFRIAKKIEEGLREHLKGAVHVKAKRVAVTYEQMQDPELDIHPRAR